MGKKGRKKRKGEGKGRNGLIFFPSGRERGGKLKRERRLDFFPCQLETERRSLLLQILNLKVKTKKLIS